MWTTTRQKNMRWDEIGTAFFWLTTATQTTAKATGGSGVRGSRGRGREGPHHHQQDVRIFSLRREPPLLVVIGGAVKVRGPNRLRIRRNLIDRTSYVLVTDSNAANVTSGAQEAAGQMVQSKTASALTWNPSKSLTIMCSLDFWFALKTGLTKCGPNGTAIVSGDLDLSSW